MLADTSGGRGLKAAVRAVVCPAAIAMLCAVLSSGQSTVSTHPASAPAKPATHPKRKRVKAEPEPVVPVAVAPAEPPAPKWPVNDPSVPARVSWNGRELIVTATNASLSQVLHEVSSATGLKVEGLDSSRDQRIFGVFGPAEAKDVLNQLLDGAGYNVIILGDRGAGNPRELVLASQTKGGGHPANVNRPGNQPVEEEVPEEPEQQPEPERPQQGPPPPGVRPAAQYLQDLRNQQQQQQLPNPGQNPTQTPPN